MGSIHSNDGQIFALHHVHSLLLLWYVTHYSIVFFSHTSYTFKTKSLLHFILKRIYINHIISATFSSIFFHLFAFYSILIWFYFSSLHFTLSPFSAMWLSKEIFVFKFSALVLVGLAAQSLATTPAPPAPSEKQYENCNCNFN